MMTQADALIWYDFYENRLFGWDIVMGIDPKSGRTDSRTRHTREAGELMRDMIFNKPDFDEFLKCIADDGDIAALWPEQFREIVRFRLDHRVPRDESEPTSDVFRSMRLEHGGKDWPAFVLDHGAPASITDHPPVPPHSERFLAWKAKTNGAGGRR